VLYSDAGASLREFCDRHGVPVAETQAGKSAIPASHPLNLGGIGVTGTAAANSLAAAADVVLAVGTRLQDFTTGSATLFSPQGCQIVALNIQPYDASKHLAIPLVADAREGLRELSETLSEWQAPVSWTERARKERHAWLSVAAQYGARPPPSRSASASLPTDAQVIGVVQRGAGASDVVVCAAGGLPGELHKHWQAQLEGGYHLEYGFSCMGYEIAGGLGVKLARPQCEVIVMVGDGSYLMLNSEIATSVALGAKLIIVLLDNGGFGCIQRLQHSTGNASFNNLRGQSASIHHRLDFAAHARSLGALASKVSGLEELERALQAARAAERTSVLVIETDPAASTTSGGHWWEVAVPEVSDRVEVQAAHATYRAARQSRTDDVNS